MAVLGHGWVDMHPPACVTGLLPSAIHTPGGGARLTEAHADDGDDGRGLRPEGLDAVIARGGAACASRP